MLHLLMPTVKKTTTVQITSNTTPVTYGIAEIDLITGAMVVSPTDNLFAPITLSVIDGTYTNIYAQAKICYALIFPAPAVGRTEADIELELAQLELDSVTKIEVTYTHGGGGVLTFDNITEPDMYETGLAEWANHLNQLLA